MPSHPVSENKTRIVDCSAVSPIQGHNDGLKLVSAQG